MTTASPTIESGSPPQHATVFVWLFAVSAIWHYTSSASELTTYWMRYDPLVSPLIFLSIATAFIAACFPYKTSALLLMCVGQLVANVIRYPFVADHLVMEIFLNLAILSSFVYLAIKRGTIRIESSEMFAVFGPIGRWLLIAMYFFGTFHKINPGFMSIASSCALPFVDGFPFYVGRLQFEWLQWAAIYGTLIIEATAMLLLLTTRTKYVGMLMGMSFHFIVGISSHGTLAHFSAFAMALHVLFVPSSFGARIFDERWVPKQLKSPSAFILLTILLIGLQFVFAFHMMSSTQGYLVNALFACFAIPLLFLVFKHGRVTASDAPYKLKSSFAALNLLPVWFFLHCMSPYIGLGTGGTMAMFSGLRTEGGISNHYIVSKPVPLFQFQEKIVYVEEASNPSLQEVANDEQGIVMFDFQRHFSYQEALILPVRLRIDGVDYELGNQDDISRFTEQHFSQQSWLARKYMSFRQVDDPNPKTCRH